MASINSGYIQVAANGWSEEHSVERAMDITPDLLENIKSTEGVTGISPRIFGYALANHGSTSKFISVLAADFDKEKYITKMHEKIIGGSYPSSVTKTEAVPEKHPGAIIGYRLAENMHIQPGSEIFLIASQFDGSLGAVRIPVSGIFRAVENNLDSYRIIIPLETGQELFAPDDVLNGIQRYTSIAVGTRDHRSALDVIEKLHHLFPDPVLEDDVEPYETENYQPVVQDWEELNPGVVQFMMLDQIQGEMMLGFLILVMSFALLNNAQMSINERIRELGILLAVGTKPRTLQLLILAELVLVILPSFFTGTAAGIAYGYYLEAYPIYLTGEYATAFEEMGFKPAIYSLVDAGELGIALASLIIPTFLFIFFATMRIFKLNPVRIISTL